MLGRIYLGAEEMKSEFLPKRLKRSVTGINTGLGVNECFIALFLENERRYREGGRPKPRTNLQITQFMINEFPKKNSKVYRRPNIAIWRYNNAKMYKGQKRPSPINRAHRYDSKGNRVDPRYFDPETD